MVKILSIFIDSDNDELIQKYKSAAEKHNISNKYADSGFDLYNPVYSQYKENSTNKVNFQVKCGMTDNDIPVGYYLYGRSSISKTNFRLSNSVGIIDSGYRGDICAYFDSFNHHNDDNYTLDTYQRIVQICSRDLEPFKIKIVEDFTEFEKTTRDTNGFGSSGL